LQPSRSKIPPDITFGHHLRAPAEKKKTLARGSRDGDIKAGMKVFAIAITMCIVGVFSWVLLAKLSLTSGQKLDKGIRSEKDPQGFGAASGPGSDTSFWQGV
jgi:hypothetical protein